MEQQLMFPRLFEPIKIRNVEIKNRIVFLPHATVYPDQQFMHTLRETYYYEERAKGGAGLIVLPSQVVQPSGVFPGLGVGFKKENIPNYKITTSRVHAHGAKMFVQLTHMGNQTKSVETFQPTLAPSNIPDLTVGEMPHQMSIEEIKEMIMAFADCAELLMTADFDGVEIKVGHDGILGQFVSLTKNKREDDYGGTTFNRARVVLEILEAIRSRIGDVPLGVRLGINRYLEGDYGVDEAVEYAKIFSKVADYISADTGTWESIDMLVPSMNIPHGFLLEDVDKIKKATGKIVIANGRIVWPATAEEALEKGYVDMVGMARAQIADPYWAKKAYENKPDEIRGCLGCNQKCMGRLLLNLPISCVQNPTSGNEEEYGEDILYKRADEKKKIVVVGGGPAGMKASEIFARRGHEVILFEKEKVLGGRVNWESRIPGRRGVSGVSRYLIHMLEKLENVDIRLGIEANEDMIMNEKPDIVIIATGSTSISGNEGYLNTIDVLNNGVEGDNIVIFDNDSTTEGMGMVEWMLKHDKNVYWVAPGFFNGQNITAPILIDYFKRIQGNPKLHLKPMSIITNKDGKRLSLFNIYYNLAETIDNVDNVVVTGVKVANDSLYLSLKNKHEEVYVIGDAAAPRDIASALQDAVGLIKRIPRI